MVEPIELRTPRLILRPWREADREPFAALNADPLVMEHFDHPLTRAESDRFVDKTLSIFAERGWGLWAAEVPGRADFIGFVGLSEPNFDATFAPCVEVGWRLAAEHWGHGFAPEGAGAAVDFGFSHLGLAEIVSFTSVGNAKSRRVMEKIGMARDPADDFEHPSLPSGHRLRHHVLYRLQRPA